MKQAVMMRPAGWRTRLALPLLAVPLLVAGGLGASGLPHGEEAGSSEQLVAVGQFVLDNGNRIEFRAEPATGEVFYTEVGALLETGPAFPNEVGALSLFERYLILAPDRSPLPQPLVAAEKMRLGDLLDELSAAPALDAFEARRALAASDRLETLIAERGLAAPADATVFASLTHALLAERVARFAPELADAARSLVSGPATKSTLPPGLTVADLCFSSVSNDLFRRFADTFGGLDINSRKDQLRPLEFLRVSSGSRERWSVSLVVSCENGTVDGRHRRRKTFGWTTDGTFALRASDDCVYSVSESGRKKKRRVEYTGGPRDTRFNHFRTATDFH